MFNRFPFILLLLSVGFLATLGFNRINYIPSNVSKEAFVLPEGKSLQFSVNNGEPLYFSDVQIGVDITDELSIVSIWFGANRENTINFILNERLQTGEYYLDEPLMQFASIKLGSENVQLFTDEFYSGKLTITTYNKVTGQLEGTFSFSAASKESTEVISIKAGAFRLMTIENSL
jgi:hypothetical protein